MRWFILGQDYWTEGAVTQEKQVREALGEKCRIVCCANGRWNLQIFTN